VDDFSERFDVGGIPGFIVCCYDRHDLALSVRFLNPSHGNSAVKDPILLCPNLGHTVRSVFLIFFVFLFFSLCSIKELTQHPMEIMHTLLSCWRIVSSAVGL
jgi:hypothetical protein